MAHARTAMRRSFWLGLSLVAALIASCGGDSQAGRDAAAASEAWAGYKSAILAKDGTTAVQHLSAETIDYYEEIRVLALEANKADLAGRSLVDRLTVITMRAKFTSAELRGIDADQLVSEAVERGLIGESGTKNTELKAVRVSGHTAQGDLVGRDGLAAGAIEFRREEGAWKVNLLPLLELAESILRQAAAQAGQTEDAFILHIVGLTTEKPLTEDIWDPSKFQNP